MHQDQCVEIARQAAVACRERHDYMPATELLAEVWQPHRWVIDAMLCAATVAEGERDRYQTGNTELLELFMKLVDGADIIDVMERVTEILGNGGLMNADRTLNWDALEARKPKQIPWEQAVNELVTDPEERARLLAMADEA
jgi:hypothetical protein